MRPFYFILLTNGCECTIEADRLEETDQHLVFFISVNVAAFCQFDKSMVISCNLIPPPKVLKDIADCRPVGIYHPR